jgi:hypothetical protein
VRALLALLVPAVAAAEPGLELMPFVGTAWTAPRARWHGEVADLWHVPQAPVVGVSLSWERDPFTTPVHTMETFRDRMAWVIGEFSFAPELEVMMLDERRPLVLAGLRIENTSAWDPLAPAKTPIMRGWFTPHVGSLDHHTVIGLDTVGQLQLTREAGTAYLVGANTWTDTSRVIQIVAALAFTIR